MSAIGPKQTCRKTQSMSLSGVKRTSDRPEISWRDGARLCTEFLEKFAVEGMPVACRSRSLIESYIAGNSTSQRVDTLTACRAQKFWRAPNDNKNCGLNRRGPLPFAHACEVCDPIDRRGRLRKPGDYRYGGFGFFGERHAHRMDRHRDL